MQPRFLDSRVAAQPPDVRLQRGLSTDGASSATVALAATAALVLMGQVAAQEATEGRATVKRDGMTALMDAAKEGNTAS